MIAKMEPKTKRERNVRPIVVIEILLVFYVAFFLRLVVPTMMYGAHLSFDDAMLRFYNDAPNGNITLLGFSTNFSFPSWQQRVKYYMGDWYNRTLNRISCKGVKIATANGKIISDQTVLYSYKTLSSQVKIKDWRVGPYLKLAHDIVSNVNLSYNDRENQQIVLVIGDSSHTGTSLPAIAKTRFSRFAIEKGTKKTFFQSIIWPLSTNRHFDSRIDEYMNLRKEGRGTDWENKTSSLIWRGGVTGINGIHRLLENHADVSARIQVVKRYFNSNTSDIDVAFPEQDRNSKHIPSKYKECRSYVRKGGTTMEQQLQYKYILSIEGNDVASGLKWQLTSNSVVFMAKPTMVSYAMEDLLIPFVHYIPVNDDYTNLHEMVDWARRNDRQCKWISEQATSYMERLWISEEAKRDNELIKGELGKIYHRQFGNAIKSSRCK